MRNILIEGRREKILDRFSENSELRDIVEEFLDHEFNRRTNYKYVDWVMKRNFDDIGNTIISFDSIIKWLEKFDRVRKNLQYKDINYYKNVQDLIDTLEVYGDTKSEERNKLKSGTEKIYEDNEVLIVKPLTKDASCYYGHGTKWCTSATVSNNMFESYKSKGPLYYLIFKNLKNDNDYYKLAIHYDVERDLMSLYDAQDRLNKNLLGFLKTLKGFSSIEKDIKDVVRYGDKGMVQQLIDIFNNLNNFITSNIRKLKRVVYGKPLKVVNTTNEEVIAEYGVRVINLSIEGDDFVFKSSSPSREGNVYDKRKVYEVIEFIELTENLKLNPRTIRYGKNLSFLILKVLELFIIENKEGINIGNDDVTYWTPMNSFSSYKFESMNPKNRYIKFLDYVKDRNEKNLPADKYDFLINVLEIDPNRVTIGGYLSTMFSSLKDAGLVSLYRAKEKPYYRYRIGPNYDEWEQGRLKRL